ncbi:MAG: hypothetical protein WCX85_03200 [Bacilli bacterium]
MKILKAIGALFVRIGHWIKDTAWVQPLLIVGAIFAVIFSIPSITGWIEGLAEDARSSEKYYQKYQRSLAGGETSEADKLIADIQDGDAKSTIGEKFFLVFVSEDCQACKESKEAFEELEKRWTGTLAPKSMIYHLNLFRFSRTKKLTKPPHTKPHSLNSLIAMVISSLKQL